MPPPSCVTADVPVHAPVSSLIEKDPAFRAKLELLTERIALEFMQPPDSDDEDNYTSSGGSGSSGDWVWFLPFANPTIATYYPRVPVRRSPPVVVLDMFGIILVSHATDFVIDMI